MRVTRGGGPHLEHACEAVQAVAHGDVQRLAEDSVAPAREGDHLGGQGPAICHDRARYREVSCDIPYYPHDIVRYRAISHDIAKYPHDIMRYPHDITRYRTISP